MSKMEALNVLCLAAFTFTFCSSIGCATQESVQSLDKRVTALEQRQKQSDASEQARQNELETCVNVDAEQAYWAYIQLNGKPVVGKLGAYTAPQYVWDRAEKERTEKVAECKLLYGPK